MEKTLAFGRRLAVCMLAIATALAFMPSFVNTAYAEVVVTTRQGDFEVKIYDPDSTGGSVIISDCTGSATEIEIPTSFTYGGKTYSAPNWEVGIGGNSGAAKGPFEGNTVLQKVAIPAGVAFIAQDAFRGCTALTEVAIEGADVYIGSNAFADCPNLKTYRIAGNTSASGCGIGQDSAGNVYPGVTVYTTEGSNAAKDVQAINEASKASGNGNQITLVYVADPYAGRTVKPASGQSNGGGSGSGSADDQKASIATGATAAAADKFLTAYSSESDPDGSVFALLQAKMSKTTKSSVKLTWKKVAGAKSYVVYGNACGKKNGFQRLAVTSKAKATFKRVAGKKVRKGTYYKFVVVALDAGNRVVSTSKGVHVATPGGKVGNHKKVTVKKSVLAKAKKLKRGKTLKLKAKAVPASGKLKVKRHRAVKYESDSPGVATVSAKGVVKARSRGKATVWAYAQDGVAAKVKVTVR